MVLLGVATLSSFSIAERQYQASKKQVGAPYGYAAPCGYRYESHGSASAAASSVASANSTPTCSYSFIGISAFPPIGQASFQCASASFKTSSGTCSPETFNKEIQGSLAYCPDGWTHDSTLPLGDPHGCFFDPPVSECESKAGDETTMQQQCGIASCSQGWVKDPNNKIGCGPASSPSKPQGSVVPPAGSVSINGCQAVFAGRKPNGKIPVRAAGTTGSFSIYCEDTYMFTGAESGAVDSPPPPKTPPQEDAQQSDGGAGTGGLTQGAGAPAGSTGAGPNGDGSGTSGELGVPCTPTATNPCTGSGINCTPTVGKPCTSTALGSGDCIPTPSQPCDGAGGSTTTDCAASPVCTGDGIQCAQVIQTWKSVCEVNRALTEYKPEDKAAAEAQATAEEAKLTDKQTQINAAGSALLTQFQQSINQGTMTQCIPDQALNVLHHSINIPYNKLCDFFKLLRAMVLIASYFYAARIIFGAL